MTLLTRFKGKLVGMDDYGNRYFEEKFLFYKPNRAPRRWVCYKGEAEASKVPAGWHAWLHFTYESPLLTPEKAWQKKHLRNTTGMPFTYVPPASLTKVDGQRRSVKKPYDAWCPCPKDPSGKSVNSVKKREICDA